MTKERRRYFRINETLGIAWELLEMPEGADSTYDAVRNPLDRIFEQDARLEQLLEEVAQKDPKTAELVGLFNQKLDRVINQVLVENRTVDRIARRVKEANISACGVGFTNDENIPEGALLKLELTLFPEETKLSLRGKVVGCDALHDKSGFYWRIDFYDVTERTQEQLIQHIVKQQSAQLKRLRREAL